MTDIMAMPGIACNKVKIASGFGKLERTDIVPD
jgi:hypothetical protein